MNPMRWREVTHFQALSAALSSTVGLGNVAGVAAAISLGARGYVLDLGVRIFRHGSQICVL